MTEEKRLGREEALPGYSLVACVGRGERGAVYRARDERTPRVVAVKIVRVADAAERRALLTALREAAALSHPNAATTYAVGEDDGRVYVVRELVEGEPIDVAARRAPEQRARWMSDAARALWTAHRRGIAHGGLGATNVLVDRDGLVRLTDFGARGATGSADEDQRAWGRLGAALFTEREPLRAVFMRAQTGAGDQFASVDHAAAAIDSSMPRTTDSIAMVGSNESPASPRDATDAETAPTDRDVRARRGVGLVMIAALAIAGMAAWLMMSARGLGRMATHADAAPITSAAAVKLAYRVEDAASSNGQARAVFAAAMQAARDAAFTQARRQLDEATKLDPSFASAHLRRVLLASQFDEGVRAHFARAYDFRGQLDAHERALLDGFEPCMRATPDLREAVARLERAVQADPNDADLLIHLGRVLWLASDFRGSITRMEEARRLDPTLAAASYYEGLARLDLGDERAIANLESCIAMSPAATTCLYELAMLDERLGACDEAQGLARRLIAIDPSSAGAYYALALALDAEGQSREAVQLVVSEYLARLPPEVREREASSMRVRQAIAYGQFDEAERTLLAWEQRLIGEPDFEQQMRPIDLRLELYLEMDRKAEAAALARATLARAAAWSSDAYMGDTTLTLQVTLYRAGAIDGAELAQRRARWLAKQQADLGLADTLRRGKWWAFAYGGIPRSRAQADEALAGLAELPPLLSTLARDPIDYDGALGVAYLLADRISEAREHLRAAHASCEWLGSPLTHVQVEGALGRALELSGATPGACEAYARVLSRWGRVRPPPLTVVEARAHARALGCERGVH